MTGTEAQDKLPLQIASKTTFTLGEKSPCLSDLRYSNSRVFRLKPFLDSTVYTIPDSCFVSKQQNESGTERSRILDESGIETFAIV